MSKTKLKGAIIGTGFFAGFQAEAWQRLPDVEIVAAADPLAERAQEFAARFSIPQVYASAEELFSNEAPDFVDIVTRPDSRWPILELAAAHHTPIICQKPMAATWDQCVRMVDLCRAADVRLLMHENWRWQPWYREIRRLIDADVFGRIFHLGFCMRSGDGRSATPYTVQPYFREMPQLLIYESLVHFLDTFRYLAGDIQSVFCQTRRINLLIAGEDYAVIHLSFMENACGLIDANRISGAVPPEVAFGVFTLEGERAALRMNAQGDLFLTEYGRPEMPHHYDKPQDGYKGDSVFAAQQHYAICLRDGVKCETEGDEYLKTVRAVFACYESAETGQIIHLNKRR